MDISSGEGIPERCQENQSAEARGNLRNRLSAKILRGTCADSGMDGEIRHCCAQSPRFDSISASGRTRSGISADLPSQGTMTSESLRVPDMENFQ